MKNKIALEIIETDQKYIGRNIATISAGDMESLGIISGDIIKISGKKDLYLRALKTGDEFQGKISLDGEARSVAGLSIREKAIISKAEKAPTLKSATLSILPHESFSNEQLKSYNSQLKDSGEFKKILADSPVSIGQKITIPTSVGKLAYSVTKVLPKKAEFGIVAESTRIEIAEDIGEGSGTNIYYEDIGGLKEEIEKVREMVEFPMKHPDIFQRLGISAPKGVLMTGPPGTGKTLLAKAVATETDANFVSIAGPEIMSKYHGGSEENLRKKFEEAVVGTLTIKCRRALEQTGLKTLIIAGGVSANVHLREVLEAAISKIGGRLYYAQPQYCTDNGAMIAYAGCQRLLAGQSDDLGIHVQPRWSLESLPTL